MYVWTNFSANASNSCCISLKTINVDFMLAPEYKLGYDQSIRIYDARFMKTI